MTEISIPLPADAFLTKEIKVSTETMWAIFCVAAASYVPLLFLQYVGEEAVYTIVSQEMMANKEYFFTTLFGQNYGRPGLYSLAIVLLSSAIGDQHMLIAARLITASSTLLTGLTLFWLVAKIFKDPLFAAFAAAVFLSGDVLLQRGWLAYSDPLFSLFTFGAMACLWVATQQRRTALLALAGLGLVCSFLTKVPTGYLYYGALAAILVWRHPNRAFLFTPWSLSIHLIAVAIPIGWNYSVAANTVFPTLLAEVLATLHGDSFSFTGYLKQIGMYPLWIVWYLLPTSVIVLYSLWSRKIPLLALKQESFLIAVLSASVSLLLYWVVPGSHIRYIMPVYPLLALAMTYVVMNSQKCIVDLAAKALIGTIGLAYVLAFLGYPLYEKYARGNYDRAAQAIIARAGRFPIYATDHTAIGLSIVADLNSRRAPTVPVTTPPSGFASGFVLADQADPNIGQVDTLLVLGRDVGGRRTRYLLCRGNACAGKTAFSSRRLVF